MHHVRKASRQENKLSLKEFSELELKKITQPSLEDASLVYTMIHNGHRLLYKRKSEYFRRYFVADNSARLNRADATFALMRDDSILEDPMSDAAMASVSNPDQDPLPHRGYRHLVEPVSVALTYYFVVI